MYLPEDIRSLLNQMFNSHNKTSNQATLHTRDRNSHGILHSQTAPASGQASLRWLHSQLQQDTSGTFLRDGRPDIKGPFIHNVCYDEHDQPGSRTQVVPSPEPSRSESAGTEPEPTNFLRILQEEDVPVLLKCDIVSPVSSSNFERIHAVQCLKLKLYIC